MRRDVCKPAVLLLASLRPWLVLYIAKEQAAWSTGQQRLRQLPAALPPRSDVKTDAQATLAGAILLLIFNFVYVLYWGLTNHGMNGVNLRKGPAPEVSPFGAGAALPLPGACASPPLRMRVRVRACARASTHLRFICMPACPRLGCRRPPIPLRSPRRLWRRCPSKDPLPQRVQLPARR